MAAPSSWGSVVNSGTTKAAKLGISTALSSTATQTTVTIEIWIWTRYRVDDSSNTLYFNNNASSATTSRGSVNIDCTSNTSWSTSNRKKLKTYTYTYTRGTSKKTIKCAAKLTGVDYIGSTMSVVASYTIPALASYTVAFNANGGSGAPSNQTKYYGKVLKISSTIPTRTGYTFLGWGTSASDTSVDYEAGEEIPTSVNKALTLYAIWKKTITLTYNANGGSGAPSAQSATIYNATTNYKFTVSSTKPTRTGYTFLGWSTSASATSATYSAGSSITLSESDILYAVWKINSYSLTVNPNGGTWNGSTASQAFMQNYNTTKSIPLPTWEGHTFSGWLLSGGGKIASTGAVATTYTYGTSNGTLTARWDTNDYIVTFDAETNGGSGSTSMTVEYGTAIGEIPVPVRKNYSFIGWFTEPTGGTQITEDYEVTENVILYAQFEIDATAYVNAENVWEEGVVYTTVDGEPKKGHAKVNVNGVWEDGICK